MRELAGARSGYLSLFVNCVKPDISTTRAQKRSYCSTRLLSANSMAVFVSYVSRNLQTRNLSYPVG